MTQFDISINQIDVFVNGVLDSATLEFLFTTIRNDTRFHCQLKQFWHFEKVDCSKLRSSCLFSWGRALDESVDQSYPQVAFIAESDVLYGMCRAYAAWVGDKLIDIGVFRNYSDALDWAYPTEFK